MRKVATFVLFCVLAVAANAIPAKRGWQTRTQADGTTIEVQVVGDEFYHFTINRDGLQVRENEKGMFEIVGQAPTASEFNARRAKAKARRAPKGIGTEPNLAPKGVVILVNFADSKMKSGHTQEVFDELCNSANCTVNDGYPSAGQYFADQSNGQYHPVFDVFGPVTLKNNVEYYGEDASSNPDDEGNDKHATDAVVEGCIKADQQFDINWADYDSDSDGNIDFVYVIYAGKGQADGGSANTIWPHNWEVSSARSYGNCTYTASECIVGGKKIENYAMSSELSGNALGGIGTLCHEFGHVMGMPDFYDTNYETNYENMLTPNDWDVMDGGAYNGDGHCPPNFSPWEKDFFGWHKPLNLGTEGQKLTLYANGEENYQAYQVSASGTYMGPTTSGLRFYFENRQLQGWDKNLPAAGLLIWRVNFNASKWINNEPNNVANNPYYTIVCSDGTQIGTDEYNDLNFGEQNVFPYKKVNSWSGVTGKPLKEITRVGKTIELVYIEEPEIPVDPFEIVWFANGQEFAKTNSTGKVVLPDDEPAACGDGQIFVGWCNSANYKHETAAPDFVKAGDKAEQGDKFYAVFATQNGEGGGVAFDGNNGGTFKIFAQVGNDKYYATATVSNSKLQSTTEETNAEDFVFEAVSGGFTIKSGKNYLVHSSKTNVSLSNQAFTWGVEEGTKGSWRLVSSTDEARALTFRAGEYNVFGGYAISNITDESEYYDLEIGDGNGVTYSNYTTSCSSETALENNPADHVAIKTVNNGQLVIIRGGVVYSLTGARVQ